VLLRRRCHGVSVHGQLLEERHRICGELLEGSLQSQPAQCAVHSAHVAGRRIPEFYLAFPIMDVALRVQHGKLVLDVAVPATASVLDLKAALRQLTSLLERNMKLIHRAKILSPDSAKLHALGISDGDKLMLLAGGPALSAPPATRPQPAVKTSTASRPEKLSSAVTGWAATGIVALRDAGVSSLPEEVVTRCAHATVVDLHNNRLQAVPPPLVSFTKCTRLTLSSCALTELDCSVLPATLQLLALDSNALTRLPDSLNTLTALRKLTVSRNALQMLPDVLALPALTLLDLSHNQLSALPSDLNACVALEELRVEHNQIVKLPTNLCALPRLAVLSCDMNRIGHLDAELLKAPALHTLSLHNNPITMERLRELDGWKAFDARRQAKVNKQLAGGVMPGSALDEGGDALMRNRHGP
jgi:uncharacterized ubiquitin-like protein YukD